MTKTSSKSKAAAAKSQTVSQAEEVSRFRKAATAYGKEATASKEAAMATLQRIGILTASGKLSRNYK